MYKTYLLALYVHGPPFTTPPWIGTRKWKPLLIINKTDLQPVVRPVELVHYFGGLVEC